MLARRIAPLRRLWAQRSLCTAVPAGAEEEEVVPAVMPGRPGRLFTWGTGSSGQLGHGSVESSGLSKYVETFPREVQLEGEPMTWKQVSCGQSVTAAITDTGALYTWGKCSYFSLGHGEAVEQENEPRLVEALDGIPIVHVDVGDYHCAAVSEEGDVYTWGWGGGFMFGYGGLGHGDTTSQPRPALVEALCDNGVAMASVACGERHTLALSREGLVYSWGNGEFGRCGNGKHSQPLPELVDVLEDSVCTQVAAGQTFSAAVADSGDLYVWGRNDQAQLGLGASVTMDMNTMEEYPLLLEALAGRTQAVSAGRSHMLATTTKGELYYWGSRNFITPHRLALSEEAGSPARSVSAGNNTSGVVLEDGRAYTWGRGFRTGALGHGEKSGFKQPQQLQLFQAVNVASVSMGSEHSAAVIE